MVNEIYDGQLASTGFCVIRPLDPISRKLVLYYVQGNSFLNPLTLIQRGTSYPAVRDSDVFAQPIPIPPLNEQHRIVAKVEELFTKLDAGVKSLETVKAQLKRCRQSVLKSAFAGKLTEEWRRTHPDELEAASMLLERIKEEQRKTAAKKYESPPLDTTNLSELPKGWAWTRVGEVAIRIQYGSSEKATEDPSGVPVLRMGNIQEGNLIFEDLKYSSKDYPQLNDFMLDPGDVLFNRTNSAELVGKTAVYEHWHPKVAFASYLIRVKVNDRIYDPQILAFFINSYYGRRYIASVVSQQVGQANVNGTKLSAMPIPLTSLSEQKAIAEEIKRCFSIAEEVEKTVVNGLRQAEKLRQSILKRAFEGKLVSQDPGDEPANLLLERIKLFKAHLNQDRKMERPTKRRDSKQRRLM
jgi:type I restriction enzyme S subunit